MLQAAVLRQWADFVQAVDAQVDAQVDAGEKSRTLPEALLLELVNVWAASEFVAQRCVFRPDILFELVASGDLHRSYSLPNTASRSASKTTSNIIPGDLAERVQQSLRPVTSIDALSTALRRLRQREMVRIAWRDIAGLANLDETMADLSALADACIQESLAWLQAALVSQLGEPRNVEGEAQALLVLGMGKLGAGELNFSSDVDLIFVYAEDGETTKGKANHVFFTQLGQQLIRVLDEGTEEGFVFRVDMRLRPFGQSGALVSSFAALERYYQSHGRDWERYALIKARVVAGDPDAGACLFDILRPFIYRRYLDFGAFEALRSMKLKVASELKRRGMANHVKLGPGGIREIEFIGQAFQLVRGGREKDLQQREIQGVLVSLNEKGLLPEYVVKELLVAYVFLRNTEHRLQEFQDRQTHQLPDDPRAQQRLAFSMGFQYWDEYLPVLRGHMTRVHSHFEQVFESPQSEYVEEDGSGLSGLWLADMTPDESMDILKTAGYEDVVTLHERLASFKAGRNYAALSRNGRSRMDCLMPLLLSAVSKLRTPDANDGLASAETTLLRLLSLLEAIARRTAYLSLLSEHPLALSQLVKLCAASPWIAALLSRHPILLDELFDSRSLYAPPQRAQLEADLQRELSNVAVGDLEQAMEALRHFKQANVLSVAAADVMDAIPLMEVSNHLSTIAEVVLQAVLELAWQYLVERHGYPASIGNVTSAVQHQDYGFAIIAYGKLGGLELGYSSDLDLVFLHHSEGGDNVVTKGPRPIADSLFYARLGQRIIHILTALTPSGALYETDMRLRPSGASGLLVTSLSSYTTYQHQQAWTWEHQALVRARAVAGDTQLWARFDEVRQNVLALPRETQVLKREISEMRERMRTTLVCKSQDCHNGEQFDLKQGYGGIADIEFMVQFGVLNWAQKASGLTAYTDNIRLLERFAQLQSKVDFLSVKDTTFLAETYRRYRAEVHRLALQDQLALVSKERFIEERRRVLTLWKQVFNGGEPPTA